MENRYSIYKAVRNIEKFEIGVSVFDTENPSEDSKLSAKTRIHQHEPCFVIEGSVGEEGADGEPLLKDLTPLTENIREFPVLFFCENCPKDYRL